MWYTVYSKGNKHQMKGNDYYEKIFFLIVYFSFNLTNLITLEISNYI